MSTSEEDFANLGLSADDWKAFILGRGTLSAQKLDAARAAVARLGRYTEKQASDTQLTDLALRRVATQYAYLWLRGETLTVEDKIKFLQAEKDCSREEAERHLEQVRKDRDEEDRILGGLG
jgi:hypothetical protein